MIPEIAERSVQSSGVLKQTAFDISVGNTVYLIRVLRSTLYKDKPRAVLREYGTNAWDEHQDAGCPERPISVQLPTELSPVLRIRDYGRGLPWELPQVEGEPLRPDIVHVYSKFGASTKRGSNNQAGSLGIGCLLEGQPIVTLRGMLPVEKVKVGDRVLTHRGRFKRVYETMTRHHVGKACRVYLVQNKKPLVLTSQHEILVGDHEGNVSWVPPRDIVGGRRHLTKGINSWRTYAVLPARLEDEVQNIDVGGILGPQYEWVANVCTRTTSFTNLCKGQPNSRPTIRVTRYEGLPATIPLTEEVGWLLGLWAAEGSATKKMVCLSLSIEEQDIADRFIAGMKTIFGLNFHQQHRPERGGLELSAHSVPHAALMVALCGKGAKNKHVPEVVFLGPQEARVGFLRGVFDGDGSSTRSRFVFGVASPDLAWGARTLMHTVEGKWGSVGHLPKHSRWGVQYKRDTKWTYSFRKGNYIFRPILKVEEFDLDADVFNFSVEEDESYISDFVLHNSKSAFCYSDSFTITSWHQGVKSIYVAVLDESDKGRVDLLQEEPSDEPSGIEIMVPVQKQDIVAFQTAARDLFLYMNPRPQINIDLPEPRITWRGKHGYWMRQAMMEWSCSSDTGRWVAIMGCVPYEVSLLQVNAQNNGSTRGGEPLPKWVVAFLKTHRGALLFDIGDIQMSADREGLEYTEKTIRRLRDKVLALLEELSQDTVQITASPDKTDWEKRQAAFHFEQDTRIQLPGETHKWAHAFVPLFKDTRPDTFTLHTINLSSKGAFRGMEPSPKVSMKAEYIVIKDIKKSVRDYVGSYPMVVVPHKPNTVDEVKAELAGLLKASGLEGMPVHVLSGMTPQMAKASKAHAAMVANPKHKERCFVLKDFGQRVLSPLSRNWDIGDREPQGDDVFVILSHFQASQNSFYQNIKALRELFQLFSMTMPPIYGIKTLIKKPVCEADVEGTPFLVWKEATLQGLLDQHPDIRDLLSTKRLAESNLLQTYHEVPKSVELGDKLETELGATHPITVFVRQYHAVVQRFAGLSDREKIILDLLSRLEIGVEEGDPREKVRDLFLPYPLISNYRPLVANPKDWAQYVRLIDKERNET